MKFLLMMAVSCLPLNAETPLKKELPKDDAYPALERFVKVLQAVHTRHPDINKLAYDRLINQALDGMLSSLDPHSSFIHPEMRQLIDESGTLNNEVKSLGLSVSENSDQIYVSAIAKESPAEQSGIRPGMEILEIDTHKADAIDLKVALQLLAGPPGKNTRLLLRIGERTEPFEISVAHRRIEQSSLIQATLLDQRKTIGYLRLTQFGPNCAKETEAALDELEDEGMEALILDLRGNGGGDLQQTVKLIGLFLPPESKVVSVRARDQPEEFLQTPTRQRRQRSYPLIILIDRNSASASELTAGSLHDLDRATLIGETSYGKGSVQNIIPMGGGTALRLTIATYHTPSGDTPHLTGITPETQIAFTEKDLENFEKSGRPDSLTPEEKVKLNEWQDPAIIAAIQAIESAQQ